MHSTILALALFLGLTPDQPAQPVAPSSNTLTTHQETRCEKIKREGGGCVMYCGKKTTICNQNSLTWTCDRFTAGKYEGSTSGWNSSGSPC